MAAWEVISVANLLDLDAEATAAHFEYPVEWIRAALAYYKAFTEEIGDAIDGNRLEEDEIRSQLPKLQTIHAGGDGSALGD